MVSNKGKKSLFASTAGIELEEADVAILNDVLLSLLAVLAFRLHSRHVLQFEEILAFHDLGADEALLEICMDDARSLGGFRSVADRPGSHLVLTRREEVNQVQRLVPRLDDSRQHGVIFLLRLI